MNQKWILDKDSKIASEEKCVISQLSIKTFRELITQEDDNGKLIASMSILPEAIALCELIIKYEDKRNPLLSVAYNLFKRNFPKEYDFLYNRPHSQVIIDLIKRTLEINGDLK